MVLMFKSQVRIFPAQDNPCNVIGQTQILGVGSRKERP